MLLPDWRIAKADPPADVTEVAVALADMVAVLTPPTEVIVVLAGMPVPVTLLPAASPVRLLNAVITLLFWVRKAVGATVEVPVVVAEAVVDIVMVSPTGSMAVTVVGVAEGIPVPVIGIPRSIPLTLDTCVMTALPKVTRPVGATELVADATADMVTVPVAALTPPCAM
jgi:hypothetical protein